MKHYIECYYADGTQILGNGDGQTVIDCKNYKRSAAYRRIPGILNGAYGVTAHRVATIKITDETGRVLEIHSKSQSSDLTNDLTNDLIKGLA